MTTLVTITPAALAQLRVALASADEPDLALRAAARRTEEGGIEFGMGLDEPREHDDVIEIDDTVTVLVSVASRDLMAGTEIDYVEVAPGDFRFVFQRAEAASCAGQAEARCGACGCGTQGGAGTPSSREADRPGEMD